MSDLITPLRTALAGRYALRRELGRGGMATVFLAEDLRHHRPVAIKVLDPGLAAALGPERFQREIETAARLSHPHILPLYESGSADGLLYYVMPYAEGESLRQRLEREKQLPLEDALRISREVADALDYAHRRGVVHRDIKPENILLQEQHAVVADFGIARAIVAAGGEKLTTTGVVIGTPAYMSPEQTVGSQDLDGRSDLYSLGCVLYEMLAGQPPFTGPTGESLAHQHLSVAPREVAELRPTVPEDVSRVIRRTLAKVAADRFGTAAEFATAIAETAEPMAARPPFERKQAGDRSADARGAKPAGHRGRWVAADAGIIVALVAIGFWQGWGPFSGRDSGPPAARRLTKDWILVAEFDGPPGDSTLAVAVRDLLSAALDQSEIVATVPREQIRLALRSAGRPASARVDAELARELAYRSSVRAVLEGTVGRLGQGYSVVLRVVDADSLKTVLTESAVAKSEDALIPTLGRLAEKLRAGLGERRAAIAASRPLNLAATPSFEANRLRVRAVGMIGEGRARGAIPLLHDALALDPDFALAWSTLGSAFGNAGQPDSALAAYDQALRRPERMTTIQRLSTEGTRALSVGDPSAALAAFDRALQYDPAYTGGAGMRAFTLWALGRLDEALAGFRRERRGNPFGATLVTRSNELLVLIALGRLYEARDSLRSFPGRQTPVPLALVEIAACNWAAAESLAALGLADPDLDDSRRAEVSACLATARAARGALRSADSTFEHVEEMALHAADLYWEDAARRARLMLSVASAGAVALPADKWVRDSSTAEIVTRGLQAAIGGNRIEAQRLLSRARSRPRNALAQHGASPALLEAQIEALGGRWGEVARILRSIASQRIETGVLHYPAGMSPIRWLLADAFEHLGRPDSAAIVLERVTRDPAPVPDESHLRGIFLPFAHRRLVLLYARMGRIEDAKLHWQIFSEAMRTPDPEIQPLIAEARAALAGAEGIAKSSAR